jgi:hypothetical protein
MSTSAIQSESWPRITLEEWETTRAPLHMWTQIVGKIRLAQTPLVNHWWNVPLVRFRPWTDYYRYAVWLNLL